MGLRLMTQLSKQVGGSHYKSYKIQPIEFILENEIPFLEANVIKYVCRWRDKNGLEDLQKAKHYLEILIERLPEIYPHQPLCSMD